MRVNLGPYPYLPHSFTVVAEGSRYIAHDQRGRRKFGGTDLATVVNSAILDLPYAGGEIKLNLAGEHIITTPILNQNKPLALRGLGGGEFTVSPRGITILKAANALNDSLIEAIGNGTYYAPPYLSDLTLHGNRTNQSTAAPALYLRGYNRTCIIQRVNVMSVLGEPLRSEGTYSMNFWIDKCQMESCSKGVYIAAVGYWFFWSKSYVFNCDTTGLYLSGAYGVHFEGGGISRNYYHGLWLDGCSRGSVIGVDFGDNNRAAGAFNDIELSGACNTLTITGNTSQQKAGVGSPQYGVHIGASCDYILVADNVLRNYVTARVFTEAGGNPNGLVTDNIG